MALALELMRDMELFPSTKIQRCLRTFAASSATSGRSAIRRSSASVTICCALRPVVTPALLRWGQALLALAAVVLLTGTLVTGSGPHSGRTRAPEDATRAQEISAAKEVKRLPIAVHDAARIHGTAVWIFLAAAVWVLVQLRRHQGDGPLARRATALITVLVLQGAVGYTQYFTGVPPGLVALHVFGATLVWIAALVLYLHLRAPVVDGSAPAPQS